MLCFIAQVDKGMLKGPAHILEFLRGILLDGKAFLVAGAERGNGGRWSCEDRKSQFHEVIGLLHERNVSGSWLH